MLEQETPFRSEDKFSKLDDLSAEVNLKKRKKIMVIDDDQDFRLNVCEMLVEEGYLVTTAKDGEVALTNLIHQTEHPDLILVDLMMPLMNGMQFRRQQESLDVIRKIPVLFVTGHGIVEGEVCLQKPFDQREFLGIIRRMRGEG
jgi:CheY-like chemotaxis protein